MSKKWIVLIEILTCVVGVVIVSIFGLLPEFTNDTVYTESVAFTCDYTLTEDGRKLVTLERPLDNNPKVFPLEWEVTPENATDKSVTFISSDPSVATVSETGFVQFLRMQGIVRITVQTNDDAKRTDTIYIEVPASTDGGHDDL